MGIRHKTQPRAIIPDVREQIFSLLVVCLSSIEAGQRHKEIRTFRNETADLLALRAWLLQEKCSYVGMESTAGEVCNASPAYRSFPVTLLFSSG